MIPTPEASERTKDLVRLHNLRPTNPLGNGSKLASTLLRKHGRCWLVECVDHCEWIGWIPQDHVEIDDV